MDRVHEHEHEHEPHYAPLRPDLAHIIPAQRRTFHLASLTVTGLVIVCDLDEQVPENVRPHMSMSMTQLLRLSDGSLIRLDMDRGVTTARYGGEKDASWKRSSAEVVAEVLTLIQADGVDQESFGWDVYAEAARARGIEVTEDGLRDLPCTVMFTDELAAIYEF